MRRSIVRKDLLTKGMHYLVASLQAHPPSVIIACGQDVRQAMREQGLLLEPEVRGMHEALGNGERWNKGIFVLDRAREIPWYGIAHPAARSGESFWRHIASIADDVRVAIRKA